jgi:hypothetical protein
MRHRHQQARAITCRIVRLDSGSSRVFARFAWLRPRRARLTPLTRPSVEPGAGNYVMAQGCCVRLPRKAHFAWLEELRRSQRCGFELVAVTMMTCVARRGRLVNHTEDLSSRSTSVG